MHSFFMLSLSLSLPHFVYHNKQSSASSSKLLVVLYLSSSCTFHVLPLIPFCRVVARWVPVYSVEWDNRIIFVERLELQLISKAGSESHLLTRRDSRSGGFELTALSSDRGYDRGLHTSVTLLRPVATCGRTHGVLFQSCYWEGHRSPRLLSEITFAGIFPFLTVSSGRTQSSGLCGCGKA